jgi:hypothetical protein
MQIYTAPRLSAVLPDPSEATVFVGLKIIMEYIAVIAREKQKGK